MRPQQRESKKDKFPNYLHHIPPEDDDKATRTLFVGNLEPTISDQDLKRIFEKYGSVEDIDVKRPQPVSLHLNSNFLIILHYVHL